jgi:uncharacterized sulfatase
MRLLFVLLLLPLTVQAGPNIVWIVAEDLSPNLGCYGDPDAKTPHLDEFAKAGVRYTRAFSHAPVCAPTRSGLITGQYPTTLGSHHMRSKLTKVPPLFTQQLQMAGYFVAWPGKTDFNFDVPKNWVDSTKNWVNDPTVLPKDKPFFAYINLNTTHESKARPTFFQHAKATKNLAPGQLHQPDAVHLPPYYPDTWEVRNNVAIYHDTVSVMDAEVGAILKILDDRKLSENTVVFFFGDHGWGLSRGKRWCYDSGLRVPLLLRWPGQLKANTVCEDLTCFLDFAPTVLSLAGVKAPDEMPGRVLIGAGAQPAAEAIYGARDRMDEAYDRIRTVRTKQYRYVKNFHPELPYVQYINYMDEMPIMRTWRRLAHEGTLNATQMQFFAKTKPVEELYDLGADPHEIKNLAGDPMYDSLRKDLASKVERWIEDTHDLGAVPETELIERGIVRDVLNGEYRERIKLHPKQSPVPDQD